METPSRLPWTWEVPLADAKITAVKREGKSLILSLDCSWTALNRAQHIKRLIFENCSPDPPGDLAGRFWFRERVTRAGARQRLCLTTTDARDRKRDYEFEFSGVTAEKERRRSKNAMNYGEIKNCDIANGQGVRVTLFVSGCTNHCEGCFQPQTWDFDFGKPFTKETEDELLTMLAPSYINGLTLLGGEPMEPQNQRALLPFVRRVRAACPEKTVWCYSGFTLEELLTDGSHPRCEVTDELLSYIDVLVDGKFVLAQKDISLRFRGSRNQRILDLPATLKTGQIHLWEDGLGK